MGDVVKFRRPTPAKRHEGNTLCRNGFHKWEAAKERPFDVKLGRLVTLWRCVRCGATRTEAK